MAHGSITDEELAELIRRTGEATSAFIRGDMSRYLELTPHARGFTLIELVITLAIIAVLAFTILTRRQIGGYTGDTVGAAQQIAETVLFAGLSAAWMPVVVLPAI